MTELSDLIKRHEGLRLKPYTDTTGNITIGYGRNLTSNGITNLEAELMFEHDLAEAEDNIFKVFPHYIPGRKWMALVDMMFNLGLTRFLTFKKMIAAIEQGDWEQASKEVLDSRYAEQVGQRAVEIAEMIR